MQISRRGALMGATAAAVVAGVPGAVANSDPVVGLSAQLNAAWKTWMSVDDRFEEACHKAGSNALAGQRVCRTIGIEPLWREREHRKAQYSNLRARLLDMPATTTRGVLAKLRGFYNDGEIADIRTGGNPDNDLPKEWSASIYRDLERLAGEARS